MIIRKPVIVIAFIGTLEYYKNKIVFVMTQNWGDGHYQAQYI